MRGLPMQFNQWLFRLLLALIPIVAFWPVLRRWYVGWAVPTRNNDPLNAPDLKLWHRILCVLLAYIFLIGPELFHQLARADIAYAELCTTDWANGGETITYQYDANGSMTGKVTNNGATDIEFVTYRYNLQNRLSRVITDSEPSSPSNTVSVVDYTYNTSGIRTSKYSFVVAQNYLDTQDEQDYATEQVVTDYLVDPSNHTGYAQVLEETTGADVTYYTIGDDVLGQTFNAGDPKYLLYDGHGSTRQLVAADGATVSDSYSYDAYGTMLGGNPTSANPTATNLLYAGEQYDANAGSYYLRTRYYDTLTGRFNQMDSYAGDTVDPQSLHKYLYCHADPINSVDPSGLFSLSEVSVIQGINKVLRRINFGAVYKVYDFADTTITAINLYNQWRSAGRIDYFMLGVLAARILPLGKIMRKVKINASKLVGASDDLTMLFRKAGRRTNKVVQTIGEMGAELTARAKGFMPTGFTRAYHGFDDIYRNGKRFVIVEAKGGTGRLAKGQMSKKWIGDRIEKMIGNPVNGALARELQQAWAEGAVDAMVVTTKIAGDQVQDPEFVLKTFADIGKEAF